MGYNTVLFEMKNIFVLLVVFAAAIICNPVMGQTKKEKKAMKAEEARLLHEMRMDSIRNAPKRAAEAEAEAKKKEEAAKAEAKRKAEEEAAYTTYKVPCWIPDDDDWYTAMASRRRAFNQQNTLATATLRAANQQMQQKIKSAFKQVTRDYFDQMDIDENSSEASHIESAGERIIDTYLNDVMEYCREQTHPSADGMIIMYIGIKVSKKGLVDALSKGLSQEQKDRLRFDEQKFREDAWKVFEKDRQDSYDDYKNERK